MVHAAIAHVQAVHHVNHTHDDLRVVSGVAVNLHVENMSTARQVMVGSFHLGLVAGGAFVVDGHMVGVGIVVAVCDAGNAAELLAVLLGELAAETLGRRSQYRIVMVIALTELVDAVAHVCDNPQAQLLRLLALAVMLARQCHKTFGQSDESDAERALVDDRLHGI